MISAILKQLLLFDEMDLSKWHADLQRPLPGSEADDGVGLINKLTSCAAFGAHVEENAVPIENSQVSKNWDCNLGTFSDEVTGS